MRDEMFDRDYQAGRAELNKAIAAFGSTIMSGFAALHDIQFRAPWTINRRHPRGL
ncbi:hypothetical protein [Sphingomonas jaspsi]|uniref:hypothetical protein n=1 Tax=Sphingomonas jaspsi TaxID=392409 RepID=UPI0004BB5406|nr:hypothetical protein [Sphingomonas jaspsi]